MGVNTKPSISKQIKCAEITAGMLYFSRAPRHLKIEDRKPTNERQPPCMAAGWSGQWQPP
eukprot:scaffold10405_cov23-Cyclotella_meneghiniana.AAC.2